MKFKIGDRVKIISKKNGDQYTTYGFKIGDICRIAKIDNNRLAIYKDKGDYFGFIFKYNVELAQENQFTKADLKHGDKCTLKNGQVIFFDKTSNYSFDSIDEQLRYFNDDVSIAKVERPIKYETVFEREDHPGGLLMYGIPNMKLDKSIIDRKVNIMKEEGIHFVTGCDVGKDIKPAELYKKYDRVILCCGAKNPRDIKADGRDAKGIYFAVDYLTQNTKSLLNSNLTDGKFVSAKGKNVVIIGGGDTGNDCVGTAIRQGAKSVTQLEMMPCPPTERAANNPWPQWPKVLKTDYGQEEAIAVFGHDPRIYKTTVKEFHKDKNGNLKELTIVSLESKKDEKTGRFMMVPVEGSEKKLPAELVLIAAGFLGTESYVAKAFGVELNARTNVSTQEGHYATNVKNVYVAGDNHRGQSLVVWAIREGREAAREVDESLMGYSYLSVQ